jgi:hypothetical protein
VSSRKPREHPSRSLVWSTGGPAHSTKTHSPAGARQLRLPAEIELSLEPLEPAALSGQLFGGRQYVTHRQRDGCVSSRCSGQERRSGNGERGDEGTGGGVDEEVVTGGDDHEQTNAG